MHQLVRKRRAVRRHDTIADHRALTKSEVNFLILITTFAGFYLASAPETSVFRTFRIAYTLVSTLLVGGGTGTLDHFFERRFVRARSLLYSARFSCRQSNVSPRQLLVASIIYLPAVFALIMLDKP